MNTIKICNKFIILIALLSSIYSIKAQDIVCPAPLMIIDTNTTVIQRTQVKFILGWNINRLKVNSVFLSVAKYPILPVSYGRMDASLCSA